MQKFTFKTVKPTGAYKSFFTSENYIKLGGHEVGSIDDGEGYKIRLMVVKADINEDGNPNCTWKWVRLKHKSETLQAAKDYLAANCELIQKTFNLHKLEK